MKDSQVRGFWDRILNNRWQVEYKLYLKKYTDDRFWRKISRYILYVLEIEIIFSSIFFENVTILFWSCR